ncbi:MAG: hypothetical protein EAY66_09365 [Sphingobacteriales bacterium]|nr:MAG: hypothetical protein EAY66_09365 [Sphingobacteriales bacterium]
MKKFLKKIKLIDYLTTYLQIDKQEFLNKLLAITDYGSTSIFSEPFEVFASNKNEFKGQVNLDGFKLKRRRKIFDTNFNIAVASGTIKEENGQLTINTEINGFNNFMIVFYIFILIFYSIFIASFSFWDSNDTFFILPFILIHGIFMSLIPYFIMRRGVKRMKYELEREFFYLTKDNLEKLSSFQKT